MYVSLDLETTGIDCAQDRIIEFGAVKFDMNGEKERLKFFINPGIPIPKIITHITNITDEDVKNAPGFKEKSQEILDFIKNFPIIGHNIQFDIGFLKENGLDIQNSPYDTFEFAGIILPDIFSYSLETLSTELNLRHKEKHRALDDSIAAMELFMILTEKFRKFDPDLIKKIQKLVKKSDWPLKNHLLTLKPKAGSHPPGKKSGPPKEKTPDESPQKPETQQPITLPQGPGLFEYSHPYDQLATQLSQKTNISIPRFLFKNLEPKGSSCEPKDSNIIDLPENIISPEKLEKFAKKDHFRTHEVTALIKYLTRSSNFLTEINLFNKEKETISQICCDEIRTPKEGNAIYSHEYIISQKPPLEKLGIIDFDKFTKNLFRQRTIYFTFEIFTQPLTSLPENETTEALIKKCEFLFAIADGIFEKTNDQNAYFPRTTVSQLDIESDEWENAKILINTLKKISLDLGEIRNSQTLPYLRAWKENLRQIQEIFFTPDLASHMIWIEKDFNQNIVIKRCPLSLKKDIQAMTSKYKNLQLIDEIIDIKDNGEFIKKLYGLPPDLKVHKDPVKNDNIEIFLTKGLMQEGDKSIPRVILDFLKEQKGSTAMIFNSKKQIEETTHILTKAGLKPISQIANSLNKLREKFRQNPDSSILLITPQTWQIFSLSHMVDTLIIDKIPFDPPSNPFILAMSTNYRNAFMEFQIPLAITNLKKIIEKIAHNKNPRIFILDPRIITKDYCNEFLNNLAELTTPKIINTANFSKIVK